MIYHKEKPYDEFSETGIPVSRIYMVNNNIVVWVPTLNVTITRKNQTSALQKWIPIFASAKQALLVFTSTAAQNKKQFYQVIVAKLILLSFRYYQALDGLSP